MRKRYRVLALAAVVAAVIVPVGFSLSLDPERGVTRATTDPIVASAALERSVVARTTGFAGGALRDVPDGAVLLAVGASLFGLAAAVRRVV